MGNVRAKRGWTAGAVVAVVATLLLSACSNDDRPRVLLGAVAQPPKVLVVGDSLLAESRTAVEDAFRARGWQAIVDGRPGSSILGGVTIGSWPARIKELVQRTDPDVVIVELGTNGCGPCASLDAAIDAVMGPLQRVKTVYWVNVKEYSPIPTDPHAINNALAWATLRHPNLHIIDMHKRFAFHPDWLIGDQIHFSYAGIAVFSQMLASALPNET